MTLPVTSGVGGGWLFIAIVLATFVSEDGATVFAAALAKNNGASVSLALAACFAGIWIGDLALFYIARFAGKKLFHHAWVLRFVSLASLRTAEEKFGQFGSVAVVASRFVPGTRLATYVTAGALKMKPRRFAVLTGICAAVWVGLIFGAAKFLRLPHGSSGSSAIGPVTEIAISISVLGLVLWIIKRHAANFTHRALALWERYRRWEFWPAWMFYPPVALMCIWLGIRYRGFSLPTIANPGQRNGGIVGESKIEILRELMRSAPQFVADGYLLAPGTVPDRVAQLRRYCEAHEIRTPFVLKPNLGQRGAGFKLAHSLADAEAYLSIVESEIVLQRYVSAEKEAGIFYVRRPGEERGEIFGITEKIFPCVVGDGEHTFEELVLADQRASRIAHTYLSRFSNLRGKVIPAGERIRLVEAGNHCQGCIFRDGRHLYSEALRERIDEISQGVPGFFIGRYDVRYSCDEDLHAGIGFTILELNGAASEATNIYDEQNTLLSAYRTLFAQWKLVFEIGAANRERGIQPVSAISVWKDWLMYQRVSSSYPAAD